MAPGCPARTRSVNFRQYPCGTFRVDDGQPTGGHDRAGERGVAAVDLQARCEARRAEAETTVDGTLRRGENGDGFAALLKSVKLALHQAA